MPNSHHPYILESVDEGRRLERQAELKGYRIEDEYRRYKASPRHVALDAGTGTGVVARYLGRRFPDATIDAFDMSNLRVEQARRETARAGLRNVSYFEASVYAIPRPDASYDRVTSRFVLEHLADPAAAVAELFRVLRPGGVAYIVDLDGIFFNAYGNDDSVNETLERLRGKLPSDLFVGRKIPRFLDQAGFARVRYEIRLMSFAGEEMAAEIELMRQRLAFAKPHFAAVLGEGEAGRFIDAYLRMLEQPTTVLFCNKFIVSGEKPRH